MIRKIRHGTRPHEFSRGNRKKKANVVEAAKKLESDSTASF